MRFKCTPSKRFGSELSGDSRALGRTCASLGSPVRRFLLCLLTNTSSSFSPFVSCPRSFRLKRHSWKSSVFFFFCESPQVTGVSFHVQVTHSRSGLRPLLSGRSYFRVLLDPKLRMFEPLVDWCQCLLMQGDVMAFHLFIYLFTQMLFIFQFPDESQLRGTTRGRPSLHVEAKQALLIILREINVFFLIR